MLETKNISEGGGVTKSNRASLEEEAVMRQTMLPINIYYQRHLVSDKDRMLVSIRYSLLIDALIKPHWVDDPWGRIMLSGIPSMDPFYPLSPNAATSPQESSLSNNAPILSNVLCDYCSWRTIYIRIFISSLWGLLTAMILNDLKRQGVLMHLPCCTSELFSCWISNDEWETEICKNYPLHSPNNHPIRNSAITQKKSIEATFQFLVDSL